MVTSSQTIASFISTTQSHVFYRDAAGKIWDSWYDGQHWNLQQINLTGMPWCSHSRRPVVIDRRCYSAPGCHTTHDIIHNARKRQDAKKRARIRLPAQPVN